MVKIYTDGSATKSRSGWGFVVVSDGGEEIAHNSGQESGATNQRMELTAALEGLKWWLKNAREDDVTIYSDSAYFCNCYNDRWWANWVSNGWVNSKKEPVANRDLWENIIKFFQLPQVTIVKVKGHSGHVYNEMADRLATGTAAKDSHLITDEKNDKINIELSEILLDYSMRKYPVEETIRRIRKACNHE